MGKASVNFRTGLLGKSVSSCLTHCLHKEEKTSSTARQVLFRLDLLVLLTLNPHPLENATQSFYSIKRQTLNHLDTTSSENDDSTILS